MPEASLPQKPYGIIYCLTNIVNGKRYIGQTTRDLEVRLAEHVRTGGGGRLIYDAIAEYGIQTFQVSVIAQASDQQMLNALEVAAIDRFVTRAPAGYNLTKGGYARLTPRLRGIRKSEQHRINLSIAKSGKPAPAVAESNRRRSGKNSATSVDWLVTTPGGQTTTVKGLAEFCRVHGLSFGCMHVVAKRIARGLFTEGHRGYLCRRVH